jgi:prepilin-type N-terminal cleavage/methylation domain-containing protein
MRGLHRNPTGLTLIELMAVLWLIGILAAVMATSIDLTGWLNLYRLKGSAKNLFVHMQKVRMSAIAENRDWAILFNTANSSYYFQVKDSSGNWVNQGDPILLAKGVVFGHGSATCDATEQRDHFTSNSPAAAITFTYKRATFDSLGLPSKSGYCYLANDSGASFAVGANTSGVIKMKKWADNDWR